MAAIAATSPIGAYQREASRLASAVPNVGGKIVNREAGFNVGPFSVRYTATDYEFDLTGATAQTPQTSFADTLDAAATVAKLAEMPALEETPPPNALTRRQALAGYAAAATARPATPSMFSVRA
ncbi:hypothetical protein [Desulfovibrio sp. TomC]|uniref:hypothetical protein n=1 Tax=Desulfovibrio sp. TomC TaxID=1562888 RepID=UPI0005737F2D|nr:hypothetical protein [Desulfovibrio sp. TomC]KHK01415.1 hypothetical protein NY78_3169 [Desulfovibrio sp. TomC]